MLGQYFTHPLVAKFMSELISPQNDQYIIDPSCGDGEFLYQLRLISKGCHLYGCEIDKEIIPITQNRISDSHLFLHNGLYSESIFEGEEDISTYIPSYAFDAVIGNPPFNGLQNKVNDKMLLKKFELGTKGGRIRTTQSIEILFLERFVKLLRPNGKLCTILPEGILSDSRLQYLRDWLNFFLVIEAVIVLPRRGVFFNADVRTVILCARKRHQNSLSNDIFYARDFQLEDLDLIQGYMKKNNIFINEEELR